MRMIFQSEVSKNGLLTDYWIRRSIRAAKTKVTTLFSVQIDRRD